MLMKKREKIQIGRSKDLPEGIFGDTSERPRIKPRLRDAVVSREMFGYDPTLRLIKKKSTPTELPKAKKVRSDRVVAIKPPKKTPRYRARSKELPDFSINYESTMPEEAKGLPLQNVVSMTEDMLKRIISNTELQTSELSHLMLQTVTPSVLAFDASSAYVKAVLASGLKIETEIDRGMAEVVQGLASLEVINFYVKRMSLSAVMKRRLMGKFIDGLSDSALLSMQRAAKSEEMSSTIRDMEAVLIKRSERQAQDREAGRAPSRKPKGPTPSSEIALPDSIRRSRKDAPRYGGF